MLQLSKTRISHPATMVEPRFVEVQMKMMRASMRTFIQNQNQK